MFYQIMNKQQFEKINNDIATINRLKIDLKQKKLDTKDEASLDDIKSETLETLRAILAFCENEHAVQNYPSE